MRDPATAMIVVVDDNVDNLFVTMELLHTRMRGTPCTSCTSGARLFELIKQKPDLRIDLILLDIQMPGADGYAVLRQIRETPSLNETKVVALTAHVMPQDVSRVQAAGFDGLLGKPLHAERFATQIRQILSGKSVWMPR